MTYENLKQNPEYKKYQNICKKHSAASLILAVFLWTIMLGINDANAGILIAVIYILLFVFTFSVITSIIRYFKKPQLIFNGKIIDSRIVKKEIQKLSYCHTEKAYQYLVSDGTNNYWGELTFDYTGSKNKYEIGKEVCFFLPAHATSKEGLII